MMDEELRAKAKENFQKKPLGYELNYELAIYTDGYVEGAEENGVVWHDLRKDKYDLPSYATELLCQKYSGRCFVGFYHHDDRKFYPYEKGNSYDVTDIVRWADIGIFLDIPEIKE